MNEDIKNLDNHVNKVQILVGAMSLFIGVLVYLTDRPPELTYFIHRYITILSLNKTLPDIFGFWGNWLPDFIHAFSFILITAGIVSCGKRGYLLISITWLLIECAFELGQRYSSLPLKLIPAWFARIPILEAFQDFFSMGTFDYYDLIAIFLGTAAAYIVLLITMERMEIHNV
jgi:hypothetical protein